MEEVAPGKLEMLDALSLLYRGRFGDAVRSAVTAIEVALEAKLTELLHQKGKTEEQIQNRLSETRNNFEARIADFEKASGKRLPGPYLSFIPYINGIVLREELGWVRILRHDIVHRGIRIDIFAVGHMRRAIETMTALFRWISWEDNHQAENPSNTAFFGAMHGRPLLPFEYTPEGVVVGERPDGNEVPFGPRLLIEQYLSSIEEGNGNLDLFTTMSFSQLHVPCADGPPEIEDDPIIRERYYIRDGERNALVFCLAFDGLIDGAAVGSVALRAMAYAREAGGGWSVLCIVHHQRGFPVEHREVDLAIPEPIVRMAASSGITLITAPDLRFLVQGAGEYQWPLGQVRDLLFLPGRQGLISPIYRRIGSVVTYYEHHSALSVQLDDGETVRLGDTIGVRLGDRYHEEPVESLEKKRKQVTAVTGPDRAGIKTRLSKTDIKVGQTVFVRDRSLSDTDGISKMLGGDSVGLLGLFRAA
jgi:hypothetical protein